jgi:TRAP-type C4-dicarboxylate transport system substrate-binding protein
LKDLQGLKIRIPKSPTFLAAYRAWGIEPTPMAYAEVFTALQQRVLDGADLPYISIVGVKWYEVQKYISELHFNAALCMVAIGEKSFQSLPADRQQILVRAGKDATAFAFDYIREAEKDSKAFLIQKGMQIDKLEDEEEWASRARSTWPQFYDKVGGKKVIEMVEKIISE